MKRCIVIIPHPDDETLSMWPMIHYLGADYECHFVFMSDGPVTAASLRLDPDPTHYAGGVQPVCSWADHNYLHDPAQEQYTVPTVEEIGLARFKEGSSAVGAMGMIPPSPGIAQTGRVFVHREGLPTNWGSSGAASSTAPPTEEGIAAVDTIIRKYIALYPNSLFFTMSPTDAHCDHRACGIALRRLKGNPVYMGPAATPRFTYTGGDPVLAPALTNAAFFVSKLYWNYTAAQYGNRLSEFCSWYPNTYPDNNLVLARRDEYTNWLRTKVLKAYTAWDPAAGVFAIGGGHSVPSQFNNCFGSALPYVSALWHF